MNQKHPYRAVIPPVSMEVSRPLWSVMIPTYNCANYLRETLSSVLAQDPGTDIMQIEVIDDYSTKDDPEAVVRELAGDRISFYRQPENVGYIKNFEICLQRSRGQLVHLLHGDDCVKDGFYHKLQLAFERNPEIGAAFCQHLYIDEHNNPQGGPALEQSESGILSKWLERISTKCRIQTPSIVVRRDVYEKLGGFDNRFSCCGEDWEMWVRIAAQYPVWYEIEPLAMYRIHSNSLSRISTRTGGDIQDIRKVIEITQDYLPSQVAKQLSKQARENWALHTIQWIVPKLLTAGYLDSVAIQTQEALRLSFSLKVITAFNRLLLQTSKFWIKKIIKSLINLKTIYY
ncbi:glycosyltransferase [Dolichospermum planctonicum UHCC 0167]|jgi:hypothetical protein|uniref:glycosyltransferase family 2 protein n=1 Tax=Dolichospermum planctonicum TaxID=136072 RepID=UPI0014436748|nr:glycosyltransferase [Dolichospermum planctonicum]MCW9682208.1 glycosyltransferase [Dolichospermum planctonicum UHCC 0167]